MAVGDVVLTLDGKSMENARQFQVDLYPRRVGELVELEVLRDGTRLTFTVAPVDRPGDPNRFQQMVRPTEHLIEKLGVLGLDLTAEVRVMLPDPRLPGGVVVAVSSARAVPVRSEPLLPGDVIHALNGNSVTNLAGLRRVLEPLGPGDAVVLQVGRAGGLLFVTLTLE